MRYIKLGTTGLDVSPVAIGAMTYGDPGRGHPVWSLDEEASRPLIKHALEAGDEIHITARARSFLHHQVRNMAGTLKLVGLGRWHPDDVARALAARDRRAGGPTAPPEGLYLVEIRYPSR